MRLTVNVCDRCGQRSDAEKEIDLRTLSLAPLKQRGRQKREAWELCSGCLTGFRNFLARAS